MDCVCRYAGADIQQLLPASFQQMFEAATDRAVTESLCVLYVAVTRAIHAWYAIIPPSSDSEKNLPRTQAGLLRAALADGGRAEPQSVLYQHGDPEWFRVGGEASPACCRRRPRNGSKVRAGGHSPGAAGGRPEARLGTCPAVRFGRRNVGFAAAPAGPRAIRRFCPRRTDSRLVGANPVDRRRRARSGPADGRRPRSADRRLGGERGPGGGTGPLPVAAGFAACAEALSRQRYENLESVGFSSAVIRQLGTRRLIPSVQNERGFAIRDGDQLLTGFIDRLVLLEDGGQVVAAEIIDFKTDEFDAQDPQQLAAKIAFYAPQLQAYQRAVSQMTTCPPERIVATLLFVEAGVVQPVELTSPGERPALAQCRLLCSGTARAVRYYGRRTGRLTPLREQKCHQRSQSKRHWALARRYSCLPPVSPRFIKSISQHTAGYNLSISSLFRSERRQPVPKGIRSSCRSRSNSRPSPANTTVSSEVASKSAPDNSRSSRSTSGAIS